MEVCGSFSHNPSTGKCTVNLDSSVTPESNSTWNTFVHSRLNLECLPPFTSYTLDQGSDVCLSFNDVLLKQAEAESLCQTQGGKLVIVDNMDIWNLLKQQLAERVIDNRIWVGAKRQADDEFYWNDGRHFSSDDVMWKPNGVEPGENCVEVKPTGGVLTTILCTYKSAVVCQFYG
ncbi:hypothetical protein V1264_010016 [Littorina saxatilis]|uniref:C-type lectin domain-containing protein n=2 Tax=Littorina saxatilis TaxID=31220 RepID=A0AAN9FZR3_9CAEN